jgi:hypothetical protein
VKGETGDEEVSVSGTAVVILVAIAFVAVLSIIIIVVVGRRSEEAKPSGQLEPEETAMIGRSPESKRAIESFLAARRVPAEQVPTERDVPTRVFRESAEGPGTPGVAILLSVIGALTILGGVILCVQTWPGDADAGYSWKPIAYTASLTWLFSGIVAGVLFFAGAAALTYLRDTRDLMRQILSRLSRSGSKTAILTPRRRLPHGWSRVR